MLKLKKRIRPKQGMLFGDLDADKQEDRTSSLVPLDFESHAVRMIFIKGEPWWVVADVCRALTIGNARDATDRLDDDEKGVGSIDTLGGPQEMSIVNEAGLFSLILASRKPEAKRFKRWLTHEVLPTLRRTGTYSIKVDDRLAKTRKRLKCDVLTAQKRVENLDVNRFTHGRIFASGGGAYHAAQWHNGGYMGQFGMNCAEIRQKLGLKGRQTPLDHMGPLPLAQNSHAKALAERLIAISAPDMPLSDQADLLEKTAREIAHSDLGKLPAGSSYGIEDDPARGKILDVITPSIAAR